LTLGKERGVIPLAGAAIQEVSATSTFNNYMTSQHTLANQPIQRDFCFSVKSIDNGNSPLIPDLIPIPNLDGKERVYLFAAASDADRKEWIRCITGMVDHAGEAMLATGGLAGMGNMMANANAIHHNMLKETNEIMSQVNQAQAGLAASGMSGLNFSNDKDTADAFGLIIKLGPNRCGFVGKNEIQ